MKAAGFYVFYFFTWLLTLLPLRALFLFSDFIFLLLYYFPSYRRKVVRTNLQNSFPEKTKEELKKIERKFYRHLADLFIEVMKLIHMGEDEMKRRFVFNNPELIERLLEEKRDLIAVLGHYNNWEWLTILSAMTRYKTISIYKPLHNKYFDNLINHHRTRFGMVLSPMSSIARELALSRKQGINTLSAFISDQTPAKDEIKLWMKFLNQDTPVYTGAARIARKYDMAILFFRINKVRRGYYSVDIEMLLEHANSVSENEITEIHVRKLEETIRANPEFWIWTHRRWKHKKPADA